MMRNRACWITGFLVLAQVGIVLGYYAAMQGDAAPPPADKAAKPAAAAVAPPEKKEVPPPATAPAPEAKEPAKADPVPSDTKTAQTPPVSHFTGDMGFPIKDEKKVEKKDDKVVKEGPAAPPVPPASKPEEPAALPPLGKAESTSQPVVPLPKNEPPASQPSGSESKGVAAAGKATDCKSTGPIIQTSGPGPDVSLPPKEPALPAPPVQSSGIAVVPPPPTVGPAPSPTVTPPSYPQSAPTGPAVIPTPEKQPVRAEACPWTLRVALVDGKTHLIAQSGKEVRFRVICDQLNLQAPRGNIEAQGSVQLTSNGLEGTCDRMTISWQRDQVVLDGQAQLKCHRDGQNLELKAAQLSLRLTPTPKAVDQEEAPRKMTHKHVHKVKEVPEENADEEECETDR